MLAIVTLLMGATLILWCSLTTMTKILKKLVDMGHTNLLEGLGDVLLH